MKEYAYIFDLDGTLFDSRHQIFRALNEVRCSAGFQTLEEEKVNELIGLPGSQLFSDIQASASDIAALLQEFREKLRVEIETENPMFPYAAEFIKKVSSKMYKVGIATSKPTALAEEVVKNSDINKFVNHIQGTDQFPAKPNPEVILKCMDKLQLKRAFMFGDRTEDMAAAKAAKVIGVGISQTVHSHVELKAAGASIVFSNFKEAMTHSNKLIEIARG